MGLLPPALALAQMQLEGGILKYFELTDGAHYHGGCFVFDERRVLDTGLATDAPAAAAENAIKS